MFWCFINLNSSSDAASGGGGGPGPHLSEDPAEEVVVPREGVPDQHLRGGVRVQQALVGGLEEALVGIEARLQEFVEELTKDAAAVDAGLVQSVSVQQVDANPFLQVGF